MIVEFSLSNFLSFKDPVAFSMVASNPVKELEEESSELNNVFFDLEKKTKYLKTAVIYGANGSGKSNLISAIHFFRNFILKSSNDRQAKDEIEVMPFLFSTATKKEPSLLEMVFVIDHIRYRYGFEVNTEKVISEWLFMLDITSTTKESYCFKRECQDFEVNSKTFKEGKGIDANTRDNALFLSTVAQLNGAISIKIQDWFRDCVGVFSGTKEMTRTFTVNNFQHNPLLKKQIVDFIKLVDVGIEDIQVEEEILELMTKIPTGDSEKINNLLEELQKEILKKIGNDVKRKEISVNSLHKTYNEANDFVSLESLAFDLESVGTQKLFALLGPWFDALEYGKTLIIDELDCSLHTKLTTELIRLFHSKANKRNAQLIFASHDTNLLRKDLFRRDQIWFTEKNNSTGSTDLYSLVEYKINQASSVRNDASFEKDYLLGKYGAIPYFGNISQFINDYANDAAHE